MLLKRVHPVQGRIVFQVILLAVFALGLSGPAFATKYAGSFMEMGGGARALGMAGAFTAVADDPSATFWNPSGIATTDAPELLLMHSELFGDLIDRDFGAYTQPVNWNIFGGSSSGIGISLMHLGVDDIPFTEHLTDQLDTNGDGTVDDDEILGLFDLQDEIRYKSDQEFALLFSYGEALGKWQVGGSLKFVHQSIGNYSSFGLGLDLGVLRPNIWNNLSVGMKLQDITTTYLHWNTGRNEYVTPALVPALAWTQPLPSWNMAVTLAASLETRFDNRRTADQYWSGSMSANSHVGLELGFSGKVFLRGGYDSGWYAKNLTAGAGFFINPLTVDYAYQGDSLDIDEVTHRISLSIRF